METPAPVAVEVVPQVHSKGYSVIVGSFREKSNADNYAAELAAQGLEVNLIPGSLRKVGIGHYQNRDEAVQAVSKLKQQ